VTHLKEQSQDCDHVTWTTKYRQASARADRKHSSGTQRDGLLFFRNASATYDNLRQSTLSMCQGSGGATRPVLSVGTHERRKAGSPHVTPEQAEILRRAITNYRKARKLMKAWEEETERLMDNETRFENCVAFPDKCQEIASARSRKK